MVSLLSTRATPVPAGELGGAPIAAVVPDSHNVAAYFLGARSICKIALFCLDFDQRRRGRRSNGISAYLR